MFRQQTHRRTRSRSRSPITNRRGRSRSRSRSRSRERNPSWWMSDREINTFNYITRGATQHVNFEDPNVLKMFDGKTPANLIAYYNVCKKRRERQDANEQLVKQKTELAKKVAILESSNGMLKTENANLKSQLSSVVDELFQHRAKVRELLQSNEELQAQLQQIKSAKPVEKVDYSQQAGGPEFGEIIDFKNNDAEPDNDEIESVSGLGSSETECSEYEPGEDEPKPKPSSKEYAKRYKTLIKISKRMLQFKQKVMALYNSGVPKSDPRVGWAFSGPQKYFDRAKATQIVNEIWG